MSIRLVVSDKQMKSPCIGVCSTGIGDSVCRGCKRFAHEIIGWNTYTEKEKLAIQNRLESLLGQVVKARLKVVNASVLRAQIAHQNIRFNPFADPYCWVFDLLKAGANQIEDLPCYGCQILPKYRDQSLVELRDGIDQDFYILSTVHYQRYFNITDCFVTENERNS